MIEKQIEEIATIICQNTEFDTMWGECYQSAKALYIAGFRKASEIFEEIEELMNKLDNRHIACGNPKQAWGIRNAMSEIAELKKKYTEGVE